MSWSKEYLTGFAFSLHSLRLVGTEKTFLYIHKDRISEILQCEVVDLHREDVFICQIYAVALKVALMFQV